MAAAAYLNMSFCISVLASSVVSWRIAFPLASAMTLVSAVWWSIFNILGTNAEKIAIMLHVVVFLSYSGVLLACAFLRRPFIFLTTWSYLLHVTYFHNFDLSNSKMDVLIMIAHPPSFIASIFVFCGFFFVSNFYGGKAPTDLIPVQPFSPVLHSAVFGWLHGCPVWCHVVDSYLNASNFKRIYADCGWLWLLGYGVIVCGLIGHVYHWLVPDTVEIYEAPKDFWHGLARTVAIKLNLDVDELTARRCSVFCFGQDFVFSFAVKLPATLGAVFAARAFGWYILENGSMQTSLEGLGALSTESLLEL